MKALILILFLMSALGCATGKLGRISKPLPAGLITLETPIFVHPVTTIDIHFDGDKARDEHRLAEEKEYLQSKYHLKIVDWLRRKGYQASIAEAEQGKGFTIKGNVRFFDHGSAAARGLVGMGAGSSNMYTDFIITDAKGAPVAKFEVIATSGGRGGFTAMGSFMEAHIEDGAEKVAEYISREQ